MRIGLRHKDVLDLIIDAPCCPQPHHIPIVDKRCLTHRQYENARLSCRFNDAEGMDMSPMLDARRKAPGSAEHESTRHRHRFSWARSLTGNDRQAAARK